MPEEQAAPMNGAAADVHAERVSQYAALEAKYKRALADYQNREKDISREREEFAKWATADLIRDFLPIVDAVDAAVGGKSSVRGKTSGVEEERSDGKTPDVEERAEAEEPAAQRGLFAIRKLCSDLLTRHGIAPVGMVGDRVDYLIHEVVGTRNEEKMTPGVILEVVQVGYTMHGRLLRPAKVIVQGEMTNDAPRVASP